MVGGSLSGLQVEGFRETGTPRRLKVCLEVLLQEVACPHMGVCQNYGAFLGP